MSDFKPRRIIVHCSATPDGEFYTARDIDEWHRAKGWSMIGYHYVIRLDGTVEPGRPTNMMGAHTKGQNRDSIGICLIGTVDFTDAQINALYNVCTSLSKSYGIDLTSVFVHNEFTDKKTCPNFSGSMIRRWLTMESRLRAISFGD